MAFSETFLDFNKRGFARSQHLNDFNMTSEIGKTPAGTTASGGLPGGSADGAGAVPVPNDGPDHLASTFGRELSLASRSIHADDYVNTHQAVAPPMHVSTTFRYDNDPDKLVPWYNAEVRGLL